MIQAQSAEKIFKEIKKAKKILIPLHIDPDGDSVASSLAFAHVLRKTGKKVIIVSADKPPNFSFLPDFKLIKNKDPANLDLSQFNLVLFLDISEISRITRYKVIKLPKKISTINIDHHTTNKRFARINKVQPKASSTCEILHDLFRKTIEIDKKLATLLYFGIFTDTGGFEFNVSPKVFKIAAFLLEKGAPHNQFVLELFRKNDLTTLRHFGKILENLKVDKNYRFVWAIVPYKEIKKLKEESKKYLEAISFLKTIEDTDFGFLLWESKKGKVRGGLRSRLQPEQGGFDVSKIAKVLGGGGHKAAAGFTLNMDLKTAERKVLKTIRSLLKTKRG